MIEFNKEEISILEKVKAISKKYRIEYFKISKISIDYRQNGRVCNLKFARKRRNNKRKNKPMNIDQSEEITINDSEEINEIVDFETENETNGIAEIEMHIINDKEINEIQGSGGTNGRDIGDYNNKNSIDNLVQSMDIDSDEKSIMSSSKLKDYLLTNHNPIYLIFKREIIPEKTYEDLLCNFIKLEMNLDKRKFHYLYQYYRIGFFLFKILEIFKKANSYHDEKLLISAIIKGCGIANLFCSSVNYSESTTRKRSTRLYNSAIRIYRTYACFPSPKFQIARTASKVYAKNFIEIGNIDKFEEFILQINKAIDSCRSYYEISDNDKTDEDSNFILTLITDDLLSDIKNYFYYPKCPLKKIGNVDSLGLVGKNSFDTERLNDTFSDFLIK